MKQLQASVLVVGAGPAGLTLACELHRRGVKTLLVELDKCYVLSEKASARRRAQVITEGDPMDLEDPSLPLGPKAGFQLVPGRNSKPGQKKTKMAIGREKSRQVGKYTFERIRV